MGQAANTHMAHPQPRRWWRTLGYPTQANRKTHGRANRACRGWQRTAAAAVAAAQLAASRGRAVLCTPRCQTARGRSAFAPPADSQALSEMRGGEQPGARQRPAARTASRPAAMRPQRTSALRLVAVGVMTLAHCARHGDAYISVTPEGNVTLYGATSVGSWEATADTSDLYVTGNVVLGRTSRSLDSGPCPPLPARARGPRAEQPLRAGAHTAASLLLRRICTTTTVTRTHAYTERVDRRASGLPVRCHFTPLVPSLGSCSFEQVESC